MASWEPIQSRVSSGTRLHLEMGGGGGATIGWHGTIPAGQCDDVYVLMSDDALWTGWLGLCGDALPGFDGLGYVVMLYQVLMG